MRLKKLKGWFVVAIVEVDIGVKRSRVDQQGYRATSLLRISSIRSDMSDRPLRAAFAARSFRLPPPRCASIASLVSLETVVFRRLAS